MARILITGASGLLGINLAFEAMREHEVIGVDRGKLRSAPFQVVRADLRQKDTIDPLIDSTQPDALIHCAALANLEKCEEDLAQAKALNTDLPATLATACARRKIRFVHISTDAVFDGTKEDFYTEEDETSPPGVYSQTKLDAEYAVQEADPHAIIARVNFYGWSLGGHRSLAEFFVNNLREGKNINGFTDVIFCPMLVNDTARLLVEMLQKDLSGIYHVVGAQPMSKYQFGVEIARTFELDENLISPRSVERSGLTAKRSHNLWLSTHKLSTDLGREIPSFSTGLAEFYTQFQLGYPQKIRSYQQDAALSA
jgi:dTDP-4-dehydrorhamnose reductase